MTGRAGQPLRVGVIGCGEISARYLREIGAAPSLSLVGCASRSQGLAAEKAAEAGTIAMSVAEMLARPDIDLIINLTEPQRHADISRAALLAGKHVYSEKPLAHDLDAARELISLALKNDLVLGCAPAVHLGSGLQQLRDLVDRQELGHINGACAAVTYTGPHIWHPNPGPLYGPAAGPLFDLGVYGLTALVFLLGPVVRVMAMGARRGHQRTSRGGSDFEIECFTQVSGLLTFACGTIGTLHCSFDATGTRMPALELQGEAGSVALANLSLPNAAIQICRNPFQWEEWQAPSGSWPESSWIIGILDLADAIRNRRAARTDVVLAFHVLEVMQGLERAVRDGGVVEIVSRCARPDPLTMYDIPRLARGTDRKASM